MNPIAVSLAKVVAQTCRFMDGEIKAKNVELIIDMPEDLAPIEGNLDLLYQVFQNLIANSIKFSGKSPRIEISAHEADAEHVVVHVADNGVGIEKEAIPKIFQKFYRAESQATRRPGLGIGLFLVQKLVQLHHGEISVTSELNKGTRFILKFPKLTSAESQSQRAAG
jgi:two-component system phosphate regulon sensor histidine kinase PhoR